MTTTDETTSLPGFEVDVHYSVDGTSEPVIERVRVLNPDQIRWDLTRVREGWPPLKEAPMLGTTFLAWAALKRSGRYAGTWETFSGEHCIHVADAPADEVTPSDPSQPAPAAGS